MPVSFKPEGYHTATPYLAVDDAAAAIDFYKRAFGAEEVMRMPMGDRIVHAEIKIGDSHIMLADEHPEMDFVGPKTRGGSTSQIMLYLEDVDAVQARAIAEGASEERAVEDQFWGDRSGSVIDPFGHRWSLATHVRDVSQEEMEAAMASMPQAAE